MKIAYGDGWNWYQLGPQEKTKALELIDSEHWPECRKWFQGVPSENVNCLDIDVVSADHEALYGSLIYQQDAKEEHDRSVFHFYVTKDYFFTMNFDFSVFEGFSDKRMRHRLKRCKNAPEAFLALAGELVHAYFKELEQFENDLRTLKWKFHHDNNKSIIEAIHKLRHELLIMKSLVMTMKKIAMAIQETFVFKNFDETEQRRTFYEIDRVLTLIKDYAGDINYLLHSEEVVTSHRGNEIFKALTIFTTLFTPVTAFGALWGMNFENMPELSFKHGYLYSLILIAGSTVLVYLYLKKKGWTGDLLKDKKKYIKKKEYF
ncbi:magnesium transporter CorA family protein [Bacillus glycinifermentans]|uniref:magnesium transporter CorA family protein n=1 Tax=Bacillus glycinifermentans TaxID=1664069 RepID=UPI002DB8013D|nr:magnesium transporter CorA family protein [Bacillus glycinifermentans]MEC3607907.1 magnesium transporter CorA family protein [Bacillus glycinifermentans]